PDRHAAPRQLASLPTRRSSDLGTFAYQWLRDGSTIAGATNSTYTLDDPDIGHTISVRVSYTDGQGFAESSTSDPTAAVVGVNDAHSGTAPLSGTPTEDATPPAP